MAGHYYNKIARFYVNYNFQENKYYKLTPKNKKIFWVKPTNNHTSRGLNKHLTESTQILNTGNKKLTKFTVSKTPYGIKALTVNYDKTKTPLLPSKG